MDEHEANRQYWINDAIYWEEQELKIIRAYHQVLLIHNEIEQLAIRLRRARINRRNSFGLQLQHRIRTLIAVKQMFCRYIRMKIRQIIDNDLSADDIY